MPNDKPNVKTITLPGPTQVRLNNLAQRLNTADRMIAEGETERARVRNDFFPLADELAGEESGVIYCARGDLAGHRLCREFQTKREVNVDALEAEIGVEAVDAILKPREIDLSLLDAAVKTGLIPESVAASATDIKRPPVLRLREPPARPKFIVAEGSLAVVGAVGQEQ